VRPLQSFCFCYRPTTRGHYLPHVYAYCIDVMASKAHPAASGDPNVWNGSQYPRDRPAPLWAERRDQDLHDLVVEQRRPILLAARNSNSRSRQGCEAAAADAHDAAIDLARVSGFDITRTLPPQSVLADWLFTSRNIETFTDTNGRSFSLRTCLVDLSEHGVVVSLSAGSALKLTDDHQQPHVTQIQRILRGSGCDLAGVFVKRFDRLSRSTSLLVLHELRALERRLGSSWSGDGELGRWDLGEMAEIFATIKGIGGRAEGQSLRRKSIAGMRRETARRMVEGRVHFALSGSIPPGLMRYRERATGRPVLAIDSPQFHPSKHEAIYGVSDVRDDAGNLIDQAATVQWVLANYGIDGRSDYDLLDELVERRYSTAGLRSRRSQGPSAYWGGPTRPVDARWARRWFESFEANLDLYESGRLSASVDDDQGPIVIENVFPAAGAWARPEDFQRIRKFLAERNNSRTAVTKWSWAGIEATADGRTITLVPSADPCPDGGFLWILSNVGANSRSTNDIPLRHRIPDRVLTAAIVDGLVAAHGLPMRPFLDQSVVDTEIRKLSLERRRKAEELDRAESHQAKQLDLIVEIDPKTGSAVMPTALRHQAMSLWEQRQEQIARLRKDLERLDRESGVLVSNNVGVPVDAMQAIVNGLRDPATNVHRSALRRAVTNLVFTSTPIKDGRWTGRRLSFEGELVFSTASGPYTVPFGSSYDYGPATQASERRMRGLALLRAGTVYDPGNIEWRGINRAEVRRAIGLSPEQFPASHCDDSALLRISMAAMYPEPFPGEDPNTVPTLEELCRDDDLVTQFGDVATLASNIRAYYARVRGKHRPTIHGGKHVTRFLIAEALNAPLDVPPGDRTQVDALRNILRPRGRAQFWEPIERARRPRPKPCAHCGGHVMVALTIPESVGYVCLDDDCRRDATGVRWPRRFNRSISCICEWQAAGFDVSTEVEGTAELEWRNRRRPRQVDALSDEQRRVLIEAYLDRSRSVRTILRECGSTTGVMYAVLREAGIEWRRKRPPVQPAARHTDNS
jgi:hypothetical protein